MKVKTSKPYQNRAKAELKKMLETNDYEGLGNIALGLGRLSLWLDMSLTEKEVAHILLEGIS